MNHERIEALSLLARMMQRETFIATGTTTWVEAMPRKFKLDETCDQDCSLAPRVAQQLNAAVAAVLAPYIAKAEREMRELMKEGNK